MQENKIQWLIDRVKEEHEELKPIMDECSVGRMPIRVFLLEGYLAAMKAAPEFNKDIYNAVKGMVGFRVFGAKAKKEDDVEEIKRQLEVITMLDEMRRRPL